MLHSRYVLRTESLQNYQLLSLQSKWLNLFPFNNVLVISTRFWKTFSFFTFRLWKEAEWKEMLEFVSPLSNVIAFVLLEKAVSPDYFPVEWKYLDNVNLSWFEVNTHHEILWLPPSLIWNDQLLKFLLWHIIATLVDGMSLDHENMDIFT